MPSSWSSTELDQAIANLKAGYLEWTRSGAPLATKVDGVEVNYIRSEQFLSAIHRLEEIKRRNAGTRKPKVRFS